MRRSRAVIEALADDTEPHYGVSTGFGALATRHIPVELRAQLQRSLVRSHAAGSGPEVEREVIRALMLLRISTLATGRTGIREETLLTYVAMLNAGITPVVHEYGSLGCSGDLAPLSHCALALMGEGVVRDVSGERMPTAQAFAAAGIRPVELREKEGLALINGTDGMLGQLVLAITDLRRLLAVADITAAMSVEGQLGTDDVFAADLQELRPQPGQARSAENLRKLLQDSEIRESHRTEACTRVQDAYSLRCSPQVAGAVRDTVSYAAQVAGFELASAVDNPVVTKDGRVESNGNFHGAPVAYVLDFLAIVAADLASISERRTDRFLDVARSHGLNAFLADDPGVDSGHMIAQYTQAAIVSEMKRLAARRPSTRSPARRCRRTTSRWAGRPPASCDGPWTGSPASWRSSCSPRPGRSSCGRRCGPRLRPVRCCRRSGTPGRRRRDRTGSSPPRSRLRSSSSPAAPPSPPPSPSPAPSTEPTGIPLTDPTPPKGTLFSPEPAFRPNTVPLGAEKGIPTWKAPVPSAHHAAPSSPLRTGVPRPRCGCS